MMGHEDDFLDEIELEDDDDTLDCLPDGIRDIQDRMMQAITSSPDIAVEPAPVEHVGLIGKGAKPGSGLLNLMGGSNVTAIR